MASSSFSVAGLFAGMGGIELGFEHSGASTKLLCENWEPAQAVLETNFPDIPIANDIQSLDQLPDVDVVAAGFPCTDLSQAGRTKGIHGKASGLVAEIFRLLKHRRVPIIALENVRNMLVLDKGAAMQFLVQELESLGYRWAYRLVDSRFTGVPQRRQRVIFIASLDQDPCEVLFSDDAGEPDPINLDGHCCGFYWTEGTRGLGWAIDAIPTLKGGSTIGIPSPPAIWNPKGDLGRKIVMPQIEEAEQLQGFPVNWTQPALKGSRGKGQRWKLVGNAVTVGVSEWLGQRILSPGTPIATGEKLQPGSRWPTAAYGSKGEVFKVSISMWPQRRPYQQLSNLINLEEAPPLSARASRGFYSRTQKSNLNFNEQFIIDIAEHVSLMSEQEQAA